jgi:preprotein translocase subunit SecG
MTIKDSLKTEREGGKNGHNFMKEILQFFVVGLGVIAIGTTLLFQRKKGDKLEDEFEGEDSQPTSQEGHGYRKRFIIGAATFVFALAAFMGNELTIAIGAILVVMAICAYLLTNRKNKPVMQ